MEVDMGDYRMTSFVVNGIEMVGRFALRDIEQLEDLRWHYIELAVEASGMKDAKELIERIK